MDLAPSYKFKLKRSAPLDTARIAKEAGDAVVLFGSPLYIRGLRLILKDPTPSLYAIRFRTEGIRVDMRTLVKRTGEGPSLPNLAQISDYIPRAEAIIYEARELAVNGRHSAAFMAQRLIEKYTANKER